MKQPESGTWKAWFRASRPPSQLYLILALFWGQAFSYFHSGTIDLGLSLVLTLYAICHQLFIVFGNDLMDLETDRLNQHATLFSGGSRVLVNELLSEKELWVGFLVTGSLCVAIGSMFSFWLKSATPIVLVFLGLFLLVAYSFPPLRISYRGGGEVLQVLGLGIVLPWLGVRIQGGQFFLSPWLFCVLLIQTAAAIATALPDHFSDKLCSKKTLVVLLGPERSGVLVGILNMAGCCLLLALLWPVASNLILLCFLIPGLSGLLYFSCHRPRPGGFLMSLKVFLAILASQSQLLIMTGYFFSV